MKKEVMIELDILNQLRLAHAAEDTGKSEGELIANALDDFLRTKGFNNLVSKDVVAA